MVKATTRGKAHEEALILWRPKPLSQTTAQGPWAGLWLVIPDLNFLVSFFALKCQVFEVYGALLAGNTLMSRFV
ncbi:hypothetical protein H5410_022488 [Solanum commersonii]|uniref:Uncharacterized protein n=1 Tax=Solanum commersonii TaxID=4109 RepID=A0A9J5ZGX0_SOLCO|nr:hypothetical protein H5410_022488 [Solanum commersonii]